MDPLARRFAALLAFVYMTGVASTFSLVVAIYHLAKGMGVHEGEVFQSMFQFGVWLTYLATITIFLRAWRLGALTTKVVEWPTTEPLICPTPHGKPCRKPARVASKDHPGSQDSSESEATSSP